MLCNKYNLERDTFSYTVIVNNPCYMLVRWRFLSRLEEVPDDVEEVSKGVNVFSRV